jgi:hypothetical protein
VVVIMIVHAFFFLLSFSFSFSFSFFFAYIKRWKCCKHYRCLIKLQCISWVCGMYACVHLYMSYVCLCVCVHCVRVRVSARPRRGGECVDVAYVKDMEQPVILFQNCIFRAF